MPLVKRPRRYADDLSSGDALVDLKPVGLGPWAGRAWVQNQPEDIWSVTIEADGETAETYSCDNQRTAMEFALGEPRIAQFYLWAPDVSEFVRHGRTQWAALVSQMTAG